MTAKIDSEERELIARIKRIVASARAKAYNAINFAQVEANWLIGQRIVEQKQRGASRARVREAYRRTGLPGTDRRVRQGVLGNEHQEL